MLNREKQKKEENNKAREVAVIVSVAQAEEALRQQRLQGHQAVVAERKQTRIAAAAAHEAGEEHIEEEAEVAPPTTVQTTIQTSATPAGATAAPSMPSPPAMGAPVSLSGGAKYTVGQGVIYLQLTNPPTLESLQDFAKHMKEAGYKLNIDDAVKQLNQQGEGKTIDVGGQKLTWGQALSHALTEKKVPLTHSEASSGSTPPPSWARASAGGAPAAPTAVTSQNPSTPAPK